MDSDSDEDLDDNYEPKFLKCAKCSQMHCANEIRANGNCAGCDEYTIDKLLSANSSLAGVASDDENDEVKLNSERDERVDLTIAPRRLLAKQDMVKDDSWTIEAVCYTLKVGVISSRDKYGNNFSQNGGHMVKFEGGMQTEIYDPPYGDKTFENDFNTGWYIDPSIVDNTPDGDTVKCI